MLAVVEVEDLIQIHSKPFVLDRMHQTAEIFVLLMVPIMSVHAFLVDFCLAWGFYGVYMGEGCFVKGSEFTCANSAAW